MVKHISADRWFELCLRLGINKDVANEYHWKLVSQYTDPDRAYHNFEHIDYIIGMLEKYRSLATNFDLLEFSAWKHDAVMYFHRRPRGFPTNEALSGAQAEEMLLRSGKPYECRALVFGNIMVTTHEEDRARTQDEMLLADVDWSPLGWSWDEYMGNREKIRHEYRHVPEKDFQNARLAWVAKACRRKSHYYLPTFKQLYDAQAQANLTRELAEFRTV